RRSGYLPEAILNFVSLLGWNPGMKTPDGKDLEKFDLAFIGDRFSLERVNRGSAKFDRGKLLSFNADAIGAMTDEQFAHRWLDWMKAPEPAPHAPTAPPPFARLLPPARALRPRAKPPRAALKPAAFVLADDDEYPFDPAAADKALLS